MLYYLDFSLLLYPGQPGIRSSHGIALSQIFLRLSNARAHMVVAELLIISIFSYSGFHLISIPLISSAFSGRFPRSSTQRSQSFLIWILLINSPPLTLPSTFSVCFPLTSTSKEKAFSLLLIFSTVPIPHSRPLICF